MVECETRTQGARIAALFARPRTQDRADQRGRTARASFRCECSTGPFDDEDVPRRVDVVGQHPVDDAPSPRAVGQLEDLADLRLAHGMGGAVAGGELRCVDLTGLAFADAPNDTGHGSMFARGAYPVMRDFHLCSD